MSPTTQFIRQRIEYENNLINQRVASLVGSQAFFVTGFTISLNAPAMFHDAHYDKIHHLLTWMLPMAGISIVLLTTLTLVAAVFSLHSLYQQAFVHQVPGDPPAHSPGLIRWIFTLNHNPL